jgi:carboxypeptidase C (cathepsin A)
MEIGPFRVRGDRLIENEGSWNEFANILFGFLNFALNANIVDQPVGTGFSFVNSDSYLHELTEVFICFGNLMADGLTIFDFSGEMDRDFSRV